MKQKILLIERYILLCLGSGMTIIMFINASGRYALGNTFLWAEEVIRILFVWAMFIAITDLFIRNGHIGFNVFANKNKYTKILNSLVTNVVLIIVGSCLVWYGMKIVGTIGKVELPATKLPNLIFFLPGILSGAIWVINGIVKILKLKGSEI